MKLVGILKLTGAAPTMTELTPIHRFADGTFAKRDDLAAGGIGAKGRQYAKMIEGQADGLPLIVGCAATSAMQLYVPTMAKRYNRRAVVYTPSRKVKTAEQEFAERHGAEVHYVRPGYMSCVRKAARDAGPCVKWNPGLATADTAAQVESFIGADESRIIVAVGSGACAVGILVGLAQRRLTHLTVVGVFVSDMADEEIVLTRAELAINPGEWVPFQQRDALAEYAAGVKAGTRAPFIAVRHPNAYDKGVRGQLADGTPLDPYYAAKAAQYVTAGDCLWVTGCRPVSLHPK